MERQVRCRFVNECSFSGQNGLPPHPSVYLIHVPSASLVLVLMILGLWSLYGTHMDGLWVDNENPIFNHYLEPIFLGIYFKYNAARKNIHTKEYFGNNQK